MTEGPHDPAADRPVAGWYPDPWVGGQYRYWTGERWTGDVFPDGVGPHLPGVPAEAPQETLASQGAVPPPPEWSPAFVWTDPVTEAPVSDEGPSRTRRWPALGWLMAIAAVIGLILGALGGYALGGGDTKRTAASNPVTTLPPAVTVPPTTPPTSPQASPPSSLPGGSGIPPGGSSSPNSAAVPTDPSASVLSGLVVRQSDVASNVVVQPIAGGDRVTGEPTLDLCNANYPSESLRTARLQVVALNGLGTSLLSTEAVLYSGPAAASQAFAELRRAAATCPATPVTSPVGEPTVTTRFNAAPDASWPQTAAVERLAFDFTVTDESGQTQHSVAVYLRRGRVLVGVYFSQPDGPQSAVGGQTTLAGIVNLFAGRLAQLPASVVNG